MERRVLVQDYAEGGQRQLDIEVAVNAQYIRQVRRLLDPRPFPNKELVLHWINKVYGHLRMGWRLLVSNCDFLLLSDDTIPAYWRNVLQTYGSMDGLVPDVSQVGKLPEPPHGRALLAGQYAFAKILLCEKYSWNHYSIIQTWVESGVRVY